ncbi:MAG: hypothetical protein H6707_07505 [Deltaproteobacteria bacterium]|nr:hypothetical protein [Deltaproteobacteria bacterium]
MSLQPAETSGVSSAIMRAKGQLNSHNRRLGSGLRLNSASDDAAASAIVAQMSARLASLNQATRNVSDGQSVLAVADQAMGEQAGILTRMRELAVQSSNGTLSDSDRSAIAEEFGALRVELDRISAASEFNGQTVLDGTSFSIMVGAETGQTVSVGGVDVDSAALGVDGSSVGSQSAAQAALAELDGAIDTLSSARGTIGAQYSRLDLADQLVSASATAMASSRSRIADASIGREAAGQHQSLLQLRSAIAVQGRAMETRGLLLDLLA